MLDVSLVTFSKDKLKDDDINDNEDDIDDNFRPDLLDWRQVERRDVRERIDLAFHIMDREYGVTRLLDPEGKPLLDSERSHKMGQVPSNYC